MAVEITIDNKTPKKMSMKKLKIDPSQGIGIPVND